MAEPLRLRAAAGSLLEQQTDAILIPVPQAGDLPPVAVEVDRAFDGLLTEMRGQREFRGERWELALLPTLGRLPARRVLLVGLGKPGDASLDTWRKAVAAAVRRLQSRQLRSLALDAAAAGWPVADAARAAAEGAELARFDPGLYRTSEPRSTPLAELVVCGGSEAALQAGLALGRARNLARELTHLPPNDMNPEALAERARETAAAVDGLECQVLGLEELAALKMGAILAVTQGSASPARLIVMRHRGREGGPTLALVGKAVTFDTGGISIKPSANMGWMKTDMAGGAAVIGAMRALAELKVPLDVVGIVPAAENMPSGTAWRPSDVIRTMNGKTVETISTDAEGRMLLADALTYAQREIGATHLVDIATLTGSIVIALGHAATGLYGTDAELTEGVRRSGEQAGEPHWPLPLYDDYRERLRSGIADLKNSGGREAGSGVAAAFLREFIEDDRPWVHLDVAGTARQEKERPYAPAGPTGVGVGTFVHLAQWLAERA